MVRMDFGRLLEQVQATRRGVF